MTLKGSQNLNLHLKGFIVIPDYRYYISISNEISDRVEKIREIISSLEVFTEEDNYIIYRSRSYTTLKRTKNFCTLTLSAISVVMNNYNIQQILDTKK